MKNTSRKSYVNPGRAFLLLFFALTLTSSVSSQVDKWGAWENGITESWWLSSRTFTNEEAASAIDRWKRIGAAKQDESGTNWAGDYFSGGETHGTYIRWSPTEGFVIAHVDKCQALVMGVIYGRVEVTPTLITFFPEFIKSSKSHGHQHSQMDEAAAMPFVPVKWQDGLILVPLSEIAEFGDYAAGLGDFNGLNAFDSLESSYFYTKYAGKNAVVYDVPVLPEPYQRILKKPITGVITSVGNTRLKRNYSYEFNSKTFKFGSNHVLASLTFVRVNVGSRDGAKVGLFMRVAEDDAVDIVRLIRIGKTSSTGVIVRDVFEDGEPDQVENAEDEKPYPSIAVGWKVTTALRSQ